MTAARHLLGDVDGRDLVLDGLWTAVPCWAGLSRCWLSPSSLSLSLSKAEPFKTILRQTEQHDLGKLTFAFVMLNIYLNFGQFLIIWSGNLPRRDQLVSRSHSRQLGHHHHPRFHLPLVDSVHHAAFARSEAQQETADVRVCQWMVFARAFDMFWLIEPNFKDAARNLHFSWGILEYIAVPVAMFCLLAGLFLRATEDAAAGAGERSASARRFWSLNMPTHNLLRAEPRSRTEHRRVDASRAMSAATPA